MTPSDRGRQVKLLCLEALAREPDARAAFLDEACAGDAALRREVESLLAGQAQLAGFLETPAWEPPSAPLTPGTRLGPVRDRRGDWRRRHGRGLQGPRHAARAHGRHQGAARRRRADPDRRRRFEQEARAASGAEPPAHLRALRHRSASLGDAQGRRLSTTS